MIEIESMRGKVLHRVAADTLVGANLEGIRLGMADLTGADLTGANLRGANLVKADLVAANLTGADLSGANLNGAHLSNADLKGARLVGAHLSRADVAGAHLREADLTGADLRGAYLGGAVVIGTRFLQCPTLKAARELLAVEHRGPSLLDAGTLRACIADLPDRFLEGTGYVPQKIEALRALYTELTLPTFSCFVVHADRKPESTFAARLCRDLRAQSLPCWNLTNDLRLGDRWQARDEGATVSKYRWIVVCSEIGVFRESAITEILRAIESERASGMRQLFPVRLDSFILSPAARERFDRLPPFRRQIDWLSSLKDAAVGDFTRDGYAQAFRQLCDALRSPAAR